MSPALRLRPEEALECQGAEARSAVRYMQNICIVRHVTVVLLLEYLPIHAKVSQPHHGLAVLQL